MRAGSTFYWLLSDHLGSTSKIATANGAFHSQKLYKPWGEERTTGTLPTRYTYTGQYSYATGGAYDFGLLFYGSRFYDPLLGRFASPDSIIPHNQRVQA
jgi:RHS repeat-associated protein